MYSTVHASDNGTFTSHEWCSRLVILGTSLERSEYTQPIIKRDSSFYLYFLRYLITSRLRKTVPVRNPNIIIQSKGCEGSFVPPTPIGQESIQEMGDVSAAFHVGDYANDPNSELCRIFSVRENQPDGLGTILKYCQDKSRFKPGDVDTTAFKEVLNSEFSDIVTEDLKPTKFNKFLQNRVGGGSGVDELVQNLPDNARLKMFLASRPSVGNYDWSMAQFITEVEGDYLSLYVVELSVHGRYNSGGGHSGETIRYACRSIDRDEMARRADDLVSKLREKERLVDWAKGMSSAGYQ